MENERKRLKEQQEFELEMEKLRLKQLEEEEEKERKNRELLEEQSRRRQEAFESKFEAIEQQTNFSTQELKDSENDLDKFLNDFELNKKATPRKTANDNFHDSSDTTIIVGTNDGEMESSKSQQSNFVRSRTETIINGFILKYKDEQAELITNEPTTTTTTTTTTNDYNNESQMAITTAKFENALKLNLNDELNYNNDAESKEDKSSKLELGLVQTTLFADWQKHNRNNFFDNIKQEFQAKLQQQSQQQSPSNNTTDTNNNNNNDNQINRMRPRSAKMKQITSIPENLLLKKSDKKRLNEINILCFHALTTYSLTTLELCTNLSYLVINNSQITALDGLQNCINLKYLNAQVRL